MNELMISSLILLLPLTLGYVITDIFLKKESISFIVLLSISYGIGTGLLSQFCFILTLLNIPLTFLNINAPIILITLILATIYKPQKRLFSSKDYKFDITKILFIILIAFNLAYILWRCLNVPIYAWDAIATHAFNAKVLYTERSLKFINNMPHEEYPLHLPFLKSWFCISLGQWNDQLIKVVIAFYSFSLAAITYYFLSYFTSKRYSALGSLLTLSSPLLLLHSTIGYRDFTITYYCISAILLVILWYKSRNDGFLYLAGLLSGFSAFTKLEGIGYFFITSFLLLIMLFKIKDTDLKKKFITFSKIFIPGLSISLLFHVWRYISLPSISNTGTYNSLSLYDIAVTFSLKQIFQLFHVIYLFFDNMIFSSNWLFIWPLFFLSLLNLSNKKQLTETKFLLLALAMFFGVYLFGYSFTQHYFWIANTTASLSRSILHFFPLAPILIILLNFSENKNNK